MDSAQSVSRFRRLLCRLGWHRPLDWEYRMADRGVLGFGGGKARCCSCGKVGLVDSQGNLF